jgi:hypothetical protein
LVRSCPNVTGAQWGRDEGPEPLELR